MKQMKAKVLVFIFMVMVLIIPAILTAGDMNPPGVPGSTMYSMEDIYNAVTAGCPECPTCSSPALVEKTGQTSCYDTNGASISCGGTGQDGELQKGVVWPTPRFTNNGEGTVKDNMTGLIWLQNANRFGLRTWAQALSDCNSLAADGVNLTDGSVAGDWRLPNVRELHSLIDFGNRSPALPSGHPFSYVQSDDIYWTSTTLLNYTEGAWVIIMRGGGVIDFAKPNSIYVWPVRGGND